MKTILAALIAFVTLVVPSASMASPQVAVVAPNPINLEPGQAQAFAAICAQAYGAASGQEVLAPPAAQPASASGAAEVVELSLIGLEGRKAKKILVNARRTGAQGQLIHTAALEALSLEDAPVVCQRLATALVNKTSVQETLTHATVTEAEATKKGRRLSSNRSLGVKTGVTMPVTTDASTAPMGAIGFDGRFEFERWFAQVGLGLLIPAVTTPGQRAYGGLSAELGASYYLTDTDFAPYVGAGIQPRLVFSGSVFNLVPYVQVGATISRKSSVRFYIDGRVGQNVLPAITTSGTGIYPTEFSLSLGVGF